MKECSFKPTIDPHSEAIAQNAIERQAILNQFSAVDMGHDLHEIAELQQSPNFKGAYHHFHPDALQSGCAL